LCGESPVWFYGLELYFTVSLAFAVVVDVGFVVLVTRLEEEAAQGPDRFFFSYLWKSFAFF
jgi:hypothetical protein